MAAVVVEVMAAVVVVIDLWAIFLSTKRSEASGEATFVPSVLGGCWVGCVVLVCAARVMRCAVACCMLRVCCASVVVVVVVVAAVRSCAFNACVVSAVCAVGELGVRCWCVGMSFRVRSAPVVFLVACAASRCAVLWCAALRCVAFCCVVLCCVASVCL